jgi:hypothetical protein
MPLDLFEPTVLRWKLPLLHARELDDIAYEKVIERRHSTTSLQPVRSSAEVLREPQR